MKTAKKKPNTAQSQLAKMAEATFWMILHRGDYNHIPEALKLLTAAYLENPNDPNLAAHLGFLHIWKITERNRLASVPPTIVNEIILAKKYFSDAVELNPHDARFLGFLGDSTLIEGSIFADQRTQVKGYFILQDAIHKWPEFNYFTAGFVMSNEKPQSKQFQEGLQWQWQTLDLCAGEKIDRNHPDFSAYMRLATQTGNKRACWNSSIAPHNFEGFFLNMGDMLVKAGDWQTAIKIYRNATLSTDYSTWAYRYLLQKRISDAQINVKRFNQEEKKHSPESTILFNSGYGCAVCHQKTQTLRVL